MSYPGGILERMFDDQLTAKDPDRLLATIAELDRREKELAALQLELLGELVRRHFTEISMAVQGIALPACSSRTPAVPST